MKMKEFEPQGGRPWRASLGSANARYYPGNHYIVFFVKFQVFCVMN